MFEYHGWVVVQSSSGQKIWSPEGLSMPDDDELHRRLPLLIQELALGEWVRFHGTVNGLHSLLLSGRRNHRDERVFDLMQWLAGHAKRSYGLLFIRDDEDADQPYDTESQFRTFRLSCGEFTELNDLATVPQPR